MRPDSPEVGAWRRRESGEGTRRGTDPRAGYDLLQSADSGNLSAEAAHIGWGGRPAGGGVRGWRGSGEGGAVGRGTAGERGGGLP